MTISLNARALGLVSLLLLSCVVVAEETPSTADSAPIGGPTRALGVYKPGRPVPLEEGFRDPPAISRVECWWQPPGSPLTRDEITRELEEFKDKGLGGVTVKDTLEMPRDEHTAPIKDIPFMSEQWLDMFAHIVAECGRLGLICRTRFGSGWNEGGPWITPEMSSKVLAFAKSDPVHGPAKYTGPVPTAKGLPTPQQLIAGDAFVLAVREADRKVLNLTTEVIKDGQLTWSVPEGGWTLLACFSKPSGVKLMSASRTGGGLHHDHLSTAAADLHIREFGGRLLARLGDFENSAFDGFDNVSWEMGIPTWTPSLRDVFIRQCGYDPVPYLPVLAGYDLGDSGRRFFYDFRTTISDLIVDNCFRYTTDWCLARGLALPWKTAGPSHVLPMDLIDVWGATDIPMGELWIHGRSNVKIPASAAYAYGKPLVCSEYGTEKPWFFAPTPALWRLRAEEGFLLGVNYLCLACVDYTPPEAGSPGWVHSQSCRIGLRQTWWPMSQPLFGYLARCCYLLQCGKPVASVAVYNSFLGQKEGLWYCPDDDNLSSQPREFNFGYVNDKLVQSMRVQNGRIVLPSGAAYEILYITPDVLYTAGLERRPKSVAVPRADMPIETLVKIRDLLRQGATVVWAGPLPKRSPSLKGYPDTDVQYEATVKELSESRQLTRLAEHDLGKLVPMLEKSAEPSAWRLSENVPLRFVHRRLPDADIFFVANRGILDEHRNLTQLLAAKDMDTGTRVHEFFAESRPVETPVTFRVKGRSVQFWWPDSGRIESVPCKETSEGVSVRIKLAPLTSVFVVIRDKPAKADTPTPGSEKDMGAVLAEQAIGGPWDLKFPDGWHTPANVTLADLKSWTEMDDAEIRCFNGIGTYTASFTLAEKPTAGAKAELDLGRVAEIGEVWLNGKHVGIAWQPPYRLDVTDSLRPGRNDLEVRVTNTWHNRLVRDASLPVAERVSRMYPPQRYERFKNRRLIESGLLGPVRIVFREVGQ